MLAELPYIFLTVFQIGLVIFVHELGHYWAARHVGIRVDAFSIGFGPRLFGWKRGTCDWKVCLVPLGGYVKMAGEDPTRPTTGRDDEFGSKTVGQRILVISAGVIMNLIFALITIPILFTIGVPFISPTVGSVSIASPAWEIGLQPGDRILEVDGKKVLGFTDIRQDIATAGETADLLVRRGEEEMKITVRPRDFGVGIPTLGIGPRYEPVPITDRDLEQGVPDPSITKVQKALREAGVTPGDRVLSIDGLDPVLWQELGLQRALASADAVSVAFGTDEGAPKLVVLPAGLVEGQGAERGNPVAGVQSGYYVSGVRAESMPAAAALQPGDQIVRINGQPILYRGDFSSALGEGLFIESHPDDERAKNPSVSFEIRRLGLDQVTKELSVGEPFVDVQTVSIELPTFGDRMRFLRALSVQGDASPRCVTPNSAMEKAGMTATDVVLDAAGRPASFDWFREKIQDSDGKEIALNLRDTEGAVREIRFTPAYRLYNEGVLGLTGLGVLVAPKEIQKVSFLESFEVGVVMTQRFITRIFDTLGSIATGRVDSKHLGGIISIFTISKDQSKRSIVQGFLFLAMISINLAILNILPIPVLDGGWLMFLIIERIKGSPISEKWMGIAQWIGLIMILGLMLYVTFNDIRRLVE